MAVWSTYAQRGRLDAPLFLQWYLGLLENDETLSNVPVALCVLMRTSLPAQDQ